MHVDGTRLELCQESAATVALIELMFFANLADRHLSKGKLSTSAQNADSDQAGCPLMISWHSPYESRTKTLCIGITSKITQQSKGYASCGQQKASKSGKFYRGLQNTQKITLYTAQQLF